MSQDKFWEQWGASQPGGQPKEPEAPRPDAGSSPGGLDDDVLAAWLKSLPPNDPLVPPPTVTPPQPAANPVDLANMWPPAAPVDPFKGIQGTPAPEAPAPAAAPSAPAAPPAVPAAPPSLDSEWDLSFDPSPAPGAPAAPAASPLPPPPAATPPAGGGGMPFGAPPPDWQPPVSAAPPMPQAAPPQPTPGISPFGPPPPPVAPPAEVLQAPPLRLSVKVGRRSFEQEVRGEALIGRSDPARGIDPEIDLRQDDAVSRRHAKIFVKEGRYILMDLNSTNGTYHNGKTVAPEVEIPLSAGDEVEVGEITTIRILEAPASHA